MDEHYDRRAQCAAGHQWHPGESCESFEKRLKPATESPFPPGYTPLPESSYRRSYLFTDEHAHSMRIEEGIIGSGEVTIMVGSSAIVLSQNQWEEVQRLYLRRKGVK